jgi:hypothetical protein
MSTDYHPHHQHNNSSGSEVSVGSAYCVVYRLENSEWIVTGEGWAQVHLYRDLNDGTHRLVGWTVLDFDVVINCNVNSSCRYKRKSDDFHKFTDEENNTYGFGFYKKEESIAESKKFLNTILDVIRTPINKGGPAPPPPRNSNINTFPGQNQQSSTPNYPPPTRSGKFPPPLTANNSNSNFNSISPINSLKSGPPPINTANSNAPPAPLRSPPAAPTRSGQFPPAIPAQYRAPVRSTPVSQSNSRQNSPPRGAQDDFGPEESKTSARRGSIGAISPHAHEAENKHMEDYYINHIPLGKMKILPPKQKKQSQTHVPTHHAKQNSNSSKPQTTVTDPHSVIHTQHVKYDPLTRSYKGLPPEWEALLNKQFGLDPAKIETVKLAAYKSRIPSVLVQMRDYLFENGGADQEGIFRLAPDASESTYIKQQINENRFQGCADIHIISNLIKVFFRELPVHILNGVSTEKVTNCDSEDQAGKIVTEMNEPYASYLLWLLDLCADVSDHADKNKMTAKNLGIVFGPNLFTPSDKDPMQSLLYSQKVANFLHKAIDWRRKRR